MSTQQRDASDVSSGQVFEPNHVLAPSAAKGAVEIKDLYATLISTRNLEIGLFWQRSNYFLVLNTGMAFGFFKFADEGYALICGALGFVASLLWFRTCLGSKFWQTRWEQRLIEFERTELPPGGTH